MTAPAHCSQEAIWDHERDTRKHDFPLHAEPKPMTTALEIAVLVQSIDLSKAADLIEQYAQTVAAGARLDGVQRAYDRINVALESPLSKEPV